MKQVQDDTQKAGRYTDVNTPPTTKAPARGLSFALTLLARPPLPSRERRKNRPPHPTHNESSHNFHPACASPLSPQGRGEKRMARAGEGRGEKKAARGKREREKRRCAGKGRGEKGAAGTGVKGEGKKGGRQVRKGRG